MAYTRYTENSSLGWAGGSYATPVAAAIYPTKDISFNPEKSVVINRGESVGRYYPGHPRAGGLYSELSFTEYLSGQPANDIPWQGGSLLRACGFYETSTGTTPDVVWSYTLGNPHLATTAPTTSTMAAVDPVDITINRDSLQYIALNMVGRVVLNFTAGELPTAKFNMRGQKATSNYTETASALSLTEGDAPVACAAATLTVTVNTGSPYTAVARSLEIDTGSTIDSREDLNGAGGFSQPIITRYAPTATLVVEGDLLASFDPDDVWRDGSKVTLGWAHNTGGGTGNVITGAFVGAVSEMPVQSDLNGKLIYTIKLAQYSGMAMPSLTWS